MASTRSVVAASALVLACVVAAEPATSAPTTIIGTVVKQSAPATIESCSVELDGEIFTPQVTLVPTAATAVAQAYDLTFLGANGKVSGRARVSPPFGSAIADGGAFTALQCSIAELRFDDGSSYTSAKPARDGHAVGNALIGIGILAAIAFLASRHTDSGPAPTDTSGAIPTDTPTATASASGTATATTTAGAVVTPVRLVGTAARTAIATPTASPTPTPTAAVRAIRVAPPVVRR